MIPLRINLTNEDATTSLGLAIAELLEPGDVLLLSGDLGAGKTTLVKAIAQGLGIDHREVTSPTFTLIHEYPEGRVPLVHADIYRLGDAAEVEETGLFEYWGAENAVAIEWAEKLSETPPGSSLEIKLRHMEDNGRSALLTPLSRSWEERLELLERRMSC